MRPLLSIGHFAQLTRLSIKALHLYEAMELLRPAHIDPDSGYRYYRITQLPLARRIRLLRAIDMPLDAIHALVHATDAEALDAQLHAHQQRIADRIRADQQALVVVQQLIDHQADDLVFSIQTKQLAAQPIAAIRVLATPTDEQQCIPALLAELDRYTAERGARDATAPSLRISHAWSDTAVDSEIAVPLTAPIPGSEHIMVRVLEPTTVAYAVHVGPHSDLWAVYWAVLEWTNEHGYERNGPPRELYVQHPAAGHAPTYRTEVQWPIRPAAHGGSAAQGDADAPP